MSAMYRLAKWSLRFPGLKRVADEWVAQSRPHPSADARLIALGRVHDGTTFDVLRLDATGQVTVMGARPHGVPSLDDIEVIVGEERLPLSAQYATRRPDFAYAHRLEDDLVGFEAVYGLGTARGPRVRIRVVAGGETWIDEARDWSAREPHYGHLLATDRVLTRDDIYGEGPPVPENAPEIVALTKLLEGRVLDFGCGSGYLVKHMREAGLDAHGIEIDRAAIRSSLHVAAAPYVHLYDGSLPLPYEGGSFDAVFSTEVVEHVPMPEKIIAELARVAKRQLILTVPDNAAIPQLFFANVVPWHMLEGTHRNFFTQQSLAQLLAPHFTSVRFARLGPSVTNGTTWYTSIAAICER